VREGCDWSHGVVCVESLRGLLQFVRQSESPLLAQTTREKWGTRRQL